MADSLFQVEAPYFKRLVSFGAISNAVDERLDLSIAILGREARMNGQVLFEVEVGSHLFAQTRHETQLGNKTYRVCRAAAVSVSASVSTAAVRATCFLLRLRTMKQQWLVFVFYIDVVMLSFKLITLLVYVFFDYFVDYFKIKDSFRIKLFL